MGWHERHALAFTAGARGALLRPEALNLEAWITCSGTSKKKNNQQQQHTLLSPLRPLSLFASVITTTTNTIIISVLRAYICVRL